MEARGRESGWGGGGVLPLMDGKGEEVRSEDGDDGDGGEGMSRSEFSPLLIGVP